MASSLGVCSGAMVHVLAASLGISAILATSALAFGIVKYIGAAYLIYLGVQSFRSGGGSFDICELSDKKMSPWQAFRQGVLVDVLNPKVALFFMAFLPQFVRPEVGHDSAQIFMLGSLVILVAVVVEFLVVMVAVQATAFFRGNRKVATWLDRFSGTVLVGLGVRLALAEKG
ncbi:lysine transporter LysE [Desulfolithobacter dissulfuricans]|uniref:Lysine transporter LysE n=1 Tax=Desulfolithobacter dissulfuricans TaxID=2795293 RepID=A0A915TZU8_9BACT|nr:lysine transporter LysE [Desulfolithobacter dissulfuricans]